LHSNNYQFVFVFITSLTRHLFLIAITLFSCGKFNSQQLLWEKSIDYGIVNSNHDGFIDLPIKNNSKKTIFIFRLDVDKRFKILYSNKKILPDSTEFIRISFSPNTKGMVKENIPIHFSCYEQPQDLEITGFTQELIESSNMACPSFRDVNTSSRLKVDFSSSIRNSKSNLDLSDYSVTLLKGGIPIIENYRQKKGDFKKSIPIGLYYVIIEKDGFHPYEKLCYVNRKNSAFEFELNQLEKSTLTNIATAETLLTEITINDVVEIDTTYNKDAFDKENFLPNNIVFLLDISTSMKYNGKLELLKAAMQELTKLLRPIDQVTIIGYSSSATVLLNTTKGNKKDTLEYTISNLKTKGLTAGGKGLKLACKQAITQYIDNGNNQVIIATDGDFNQGDENVNKIAKKHKKCGLIVSVIGIKTKPEPEENMRTLAKNGGGNYIAIDSYDRALNSLVNEIKINSFKGLKK